MHSQKSFCNKLVMAARPDCLAACARRKSPETYSSFVEGGGEVRGPTSPEAWAALGTIEGRVE